MGSDEGMDIPFEVVDPDYRELDRVLSLAFDQASKGKGKERHACNLPFEQQPIIRIQQLVGQGYALGQAMKKLQESQRLPKKMALAEMLGAIVYIAAAYLYTESSTIKE